MAAPRTSKFKRFAIDDGAARSVQGPGACGTLQDASVATSLGAGTVFDMTAWVNDYVQLEAETADVYVLFMAPAAGGGAPTPVQGTDFDETISQKSFTANNAEAKNFIIPTRIYAGASPRSFIVPEGAPYLAYKGVASGGKLRAFHG